MPTYEYVCDPCDRRFEHFQSMSSPKLEECRECGGPLRRLIGSGAATIFKGPGFYVNDYKVGRRAVERRAKKEG